MFSKLIVLFLFVISVAQVKPGMAAESTPSLYDRYTITCAADSATDAQYSAIITATLWSYHEIPSHVNPSGDGHVTIVGRGGALVFDGVSVKFNSASTGAGFTDLENFPQVLNYSELYQVPRYALKLDLATGVGTFGIRGGVSYNFKSQCKLDSVTCPVLCHLRPHGIEECQPSCPAQPVPGLPVSGQ